MSSDSASSASGSPEPVAVPEAKRKRSKTAPEDELEIDVNLPEPPSKKAKRAEKKKKSKKPTSDSADADSEKTKDAEAEEVKKVDPNAPVQRSKWSIWIGNLPFSANKESLRTFFVDNGNMTEDDITRMHMPAPMNKDNKRPGPKPQNKGFAYVDFNTKEQLESALTLSEKLVMGRRVLIKNATSFEGRPDKVAQTQAIAEGAAPVPAAAAEKPATKRVFVGNLSFDVTQEELYEHYSQAGQVEDVHMATFEDSGKCKGFAWVRFVEIESAEAAVKGYVFKDMNKDDDDESEDDEKSGSDDEAPKKKKKQNKRKWFINRLHARPLRCEFAEDAQTRYKKRFGKDAAPRNDRREVAGGDGAENVEFGGGAGDGPPGRRPRLDKDQRQAERRAKHDARKIAPGQANANAQRATGAIVEAKGTKVTFD